MKKSARQDATAGQRNSLNTDRTKKAPQRRDVLASLRATQIVASKPALPAELIAVILDYLPAPTLIKCAQASRRLQEMVYDDTRWIQKLKAMGVWDEAEARQRHDESMRRKVETQKSKEADETQRTGVDLNGSVNGIAGGGRIWGASVTIFDANVEQERHNKSVERPPPRKKRSLTDGFEDLALSPTSPTFARGRGASFDSAAALTALRKARSIRGCARQEYGRIHRALAPLFADLTDPSTSHDPLVFRLYQQPEDQAQVLGSLQRFALCDCGEGYDQRKQSLESAINSFENAALQEFQQAYELQDIERLQRYTSVLVTLDGGSRVVDCFIQSHPIMQRTRRMGNPLDCLDGVAHGHVDLSPSHRFFEQLAGLINEQASLIDQVFPPSLEVLLPFITRISEDVVQEYTNTLFDEAHRKGKETYLKAVAGVYEQSKRCVVSIHPSKASASDFKEDCDRILMQCFEPHVDLYFSEELDFFKAKSDEEVSIWEKQLSDQEAQQESFFMSNVNRQAVKRDFLSSFKKVVMMPVNVLPAFPGTASKSSTTTQRAIEISDEKSISRSSSPSLSGRSRASTTEAPTTELAAKAAIMNSRLEGIKSLFSIEVALNLIHYAKSAIERCAIFARTSNQFSVRAKTQCEAIFINLLYILGQRHIKAGFDTAVGHLSKYNPRDVKTGQSTSSIRVEPLVTFLELVNVGDLIQQMVDVFYVQELVSTHLTERDDFLNPAGKEKKRFEQMLDERVAAGMSKGIDVLMDEVDYICATTQVSTDFNPGAAVGTDKGPYSGFGGGIVDIGPSATANQVVETISSHTGMLVGSTDKNMLDVFNQEVGLRLFGTLCKHIKRQRISVDGAIKLISDINHYSTFITTLRQKPLLPYFSALRELSQIYLIDCSSTPTPSPNSKNKNTTTTTSSKPTTAKNTSAKELATIIADTDRYRGIFAVEEVYEFAERRADWYVVKKDVERAMYGIGCCVM